MFMHFSPDCFLNLIILSISIKLLHVIPVVWNDNWRWEIWIFVLRLFQPFIIILRLISIKQVGIWLERMEILRIFNVHLRLILIYIFLMKLLWIWLILLCIIWLKLLLIRLKLLMVWLELLLVWLKLVPTFILFSFDRVIVVWWRIHEIIKLIVKLSLTRYWWVVWGILLNIHFWFFVFCMEKWPWSFS